MHGARRRRTGPQSEAMDGRKRSVTTANATVVEAMVLFVLLLLWVYICSVERVRTSFCELWFFICRVGGKMRMVLFMGCVYDFGVNYAITSQCIGHAFMFIDPLQCGL